MDHVDKLNEYESIDEGFELVYLKLVVDGYIWSEARERLILGKSCLFHFIVLGIYSPLLLYI